MAELQDAVDAVRAFLADEAAAERAVFLEPDEARCRAALGRAESHLDSAVPLGFGRAPGGPPVASDDATRAAAERRRPRILYAVVRHSRDGAPVFRAYTASGPDTKGVMYALVWNLAEADGALKIVGRTDYSPFGQPGELAWEPFAGDQLDGAGPPQEAVKLRRPLADPFAAHYDALPGEEDERR